MLTQGGGITIDFNSATPMVLLKHSETEPTQFNSDALDLLTSSVVAEATASGVKFASTYWINIRGFKYNVSR